MSNDPEAEWGKYSNESFSKQEQFSRTLQELTAKAGELDAAARLIGSDADSSSFRRQIDAMRAKAHELVNSSAALVKELAPTVPKPQREKILAEHSRTVERVLTAEKSLTTKIQRTDQQKNVGSGRKGADGVGDAGGNEGNSQNYGGGSDVLLVETESADKSIIGLFSEMEKNLKLFRSCSLLLSVSMSPFP